MANNYYARGVAFHDPNFRTAVSFCARNAAQLILADGVSTGPRRRMAEDLASEQFILGDYRANQANQIFSMDILSNVTIALSLLDENGDYDLKGSSASDFEYQVAASWDAIAERLYPDPEPASEPE